MIVNFISVLAIATNSSHHRASLRTRAHGSRFFARSRGATCATLTRTPLRRPLSAMVGMSFSATPTHQTNLSTQKPSLGIFTAHKDRRRCSQWVEGSIPGSATNYHPPKPANSAGSVFAQKSWWRSLPAKSAPRGTQNGTQRFRPEKGSFFDSEKHPTFGLKRRAKRASRWRSPRFRNSTRSHFRHRRG